MPASAPVGFHPLALPASLQPVVVTVTALVLLVFALAIQFEFVRAALGGGPEPETDRTNCGSCGARISMDADACPHCDAHRDGN